MATASKRPRFAAYLRISKDPDGTSDAPERQLADLRRFAKLKGWDIVETFEDRDLSAFRRDVVRPGYEALLEALAAGEFDGVLVWRLDRLVRRTVEFSRFWTVCEDAGAVLASATQPIDTSDPVGMLVVHILVAFAEMESATTSTRLKAKEAHLAKQGKHKGAGRRAYGMQPGWQKVNAKEARIVREIAERMLAGESVGSIVTNLNDRGVPSATGGAWSRRSVTVLMHQARLFAKREHLGEIVADGEWPAILDEVTGMRLRALIDGRTTTTTDRRQHLLSGILRCGKCGAPMKAGGSASARKYVCPSKTDGGCNGTSILQQATDDVVSADVVAALDSPELAKVLRARSHKRPDDAELLAEVAELDARAEELAEMWAAGELTRAAMLAAQRKLTDRQDAATERLATMHDTEPVERLLAAPGGLSAAWERMPVSRQRAVIASLVERVVVHGAGSDWYRARLRESLLDEADAYRQAGDEVAARRRERQAEARTGGGGSFRPERLEMVWRV